MKRFFICLFTVGLIVFVGCSAKRATVPYWKTSSVLSSKEPMFECKILMEKTTFKSNEKIPVHFSVRNLTNEQHRALFGIMPEEKSYLGGTWLSFAPNETKEATIIVTPESPWWGPGVYNMVIVARSGSFVASWPTYNFPTSCEPVRINIEGEE